MRSGDFGGLVPATLDEHDRKLVRLLQEDGRLSVTAMAKEIGLSHAAVRQRIARMLGDNVLSVGAVTHPGTHGYARSAMICVRVDHRLTEVAEALAEIEQVYYLVSTTGRYDLLAEVMAADDHDLQSLITTIRAVPGVVDAESVPFVDTIKWAFKPAFL